MLVKLPNPECLGAKLNRETFLSFFIFPTRDKHTSQYSKKPGTDWSAHQSFLFVGPWHQKSDIKSGTIQNPTMQVSFLYILFVTDIILCSSYFNLENHKIEDYQLEDSNLNDRRLSNLKITLKIKTYLKRQNLENSWNRPWKIVTYQDLLVKDRLKLTLWR